MTSWSMHPRAAFDLETTGKDPRTARIVTASIVMVDETGTVADTYEWLADPGVEIPEEAAAIHGISTAHARENGRPADEVAAEVGAVLATLFANNIPVIAFNASYDFTVLANEARRHELPQITPAPVIDPFICNKHVDRFRKGSRTLVALCEEYGINLDDAHTSAADALATLRLADALAAKYSSLRIDLGDLHNAQVDWAREQAADFQQYLRRVKDPVAVVEGDWPVLP
ncbi:DNA polymerase III subunit epsilon [Arthrobacter alpinus]|uniref:DNA polymerase III subunit epsilon n=1 Tax=Arthrobacter alpinus TaxID=656366 RepID=A0A0M3UGB0_9MICC|nr:MULTISPECIES: 3'-5' exonuclease [Arthrobacter]ALE92775.1 DNA polymerase III subunit epsilon [Arthrobacter alpinus]